MIKIGVHLRKLSQN